MWCIKSITGCLHAPRFVGRILYSKLIERKKFDLICFPRICFPGLIYCDQEPLRLLNVIQDDCNFCFLKSLRLAPTGSAFGIVLYYMRAPVFPPSCCTSDFVDIKAVRVPSLWRSCLSNIGVVAATPYPRLREPEKRLADPSNDKSSYPVVDWGNSYKPFSSQGEYHFTFSYRHIINSNRAPKQWSLTKNETITTFEAWRQNLQYSLSLDANFVPFLADNFTWLKKSSTAPNRGLEPDGDDVPTTRRRTAFQKNLHLELMLGQIANFCQLLPRYFT